MSREYSDKKRLLPKVVPCSAMEHCCSLIRKRNTWETRRQNNGNKWQSSCSLFLHLTRDGDLVCRFNKIHLPFIVNRNVAFQIDLYVKMRNCQGEFYIRKGNKNYQTGTKGFHCLCMWWTAGPCQRVVQAIFQIVWPGDCKNAEAWNQTAHPDRRSKRSGPF